MNIKNWDALQTAYQVAKLGTVSAAAHTLNMHRATVIRHVDALEHELACKLFQRHSRGYTMTEMGKELLHAASIAEAQFLRLKSRAKDSEELSGEFIVTSMEFIAPYILPSLYKLKKQHPNLNLRYLNSEALYKLEYGEAHIAIRSGVRPTQSDYIVKPFKTLKMGLFAHRGYFEIYGNPLSLAEFSQHKFILPDSNDVKASILLWLKKHVPRDSTILQGNDRMIVYQAVLAGLGIGAMFTHEAQNYSELIEMYPAEKDWHVQNWLVTHKDLHESQKVQLFLDLLSTEISTMPSNED